jgi:DNA-binding transcriptional regulator YdaS (Cro superfamily)
MKAASPAERKGLAALLAYLNSLPAEGRERFAKRCGTTQNYLRKAISKGQQLSVETSILIDQESGGMVRCEQLRADVNWDYLARRSPECVA